MMTYKKTPFIIAFVLVLVGSAASLFIKASANEFAYDGPYVDVVTEIARRNPSSDGPQIIKVDLETGMAAPLSMNIVDKNGNIIGSHVTLQMPMEDGTYSLVFVNDELVGFYPPDTTASEKLQGAMSTDEETRNVLLDAYRGYIQDFLLEDTEKNA